MLWPNEMGIPRAVEGCKIALALPCNVYYVISSMYPLPVKPQSSAGIRDFKGGSVCNRKAVFWQQQERIFEVHGLGLFCFVFFKQF